MWLSSGTNENSDGDSLQDSRPTTRLSPKNNLFRTFHWRNYSISWHQPQRTGHFIRLSREDMTPLLSLKRERMNWPRMKTSWELTMTVPPAPRHAQSAQETIHCISAEHSWVTTKSGMVKWSKIIGIVPTAWHPTTSALQHTTARDVPGDTIQSYIETLTKNL